MDEEPQTPDRTAPESIEGLQKLLADAEGVVVEFAIMMRTEKERAQFERERLSRELEELESKRTGPWGCVYCKVPVATSEEMAKHHARHCGDEIDRSMEPWRRKYPGAFPGWREGGITPAINDVQIQKKPPAN